LHIDDNISLNSPQNKKSFRENFVEKIKTTFHVQQLFFRKSCHLGDNVQTYGKARTATDDNIT